MANERDQNIEEPAGTRDEEIEGRVDERDSDDEFEEVDDMEEEEEEDLE